MSHGPLPDRDDTASAAARTGLAAALDRGLAILNRIIVVFAALALIAASAILSYSVLSRALFKAANYWQDEAAVFLLVGATFLSAPYVQSMRGHIAIEAIEGFLPERIERVREILSDIICLLFCAFFAWQSWLLLLEAIDDGRVTDSAWAPPLWIPYSIMTAGMSILTLRLVLQVVQAFGGRRGIGA